ncbi:MAG: hypothetical protein HY879_27675 [Deltaproteobacteria bacterium]|nr:hypothetical protein [Deltaproteobacteria bacterium]
MSDAEILHKELEEILKHKWIESEKAGYDLGDQAVWDWVQKYAHEFREYWQKKNSS